MKILYLASRGRAERMGVKETENDVLTLSFSPRVVGAVLLGEKILPLKDGEASVPISALADGKHEPRLESENGIFVAEEFIKQGSHITVPDADEELVRRLVIKCHALDCELAEMKKRVASLEKLCCGHNLFDFERKEYE